MFCKGGLVGGLLERSSTDNMAGEKLGSLFIIRYMWLWSNPERKYFYSAFLEQHLDTSDYLLSLEIQFILNHLGFLFLFQWKDGEICPLNLSFGPAPEHLCEAERSQVSLCGQAKQTGGISKFHVNILCRSSKAGSFFFPLTLAPKNGLLLQLES